MPDRLSARRLRAGRIEYINSLPIDAGLLLGRVPHEMDLIPGKPAECNARIASGALQISPVSALFFAQHNAELLMLPELSISSESGVQSVLLFSRRPLAELSGVPIAVKGHGRTTPALLQILCEHFYRFTPTWAEAEDRPGLVPGSEACLLIGDEALLAGDSGEAGSWIVTDLAEEWRRWTALPVVFAVWAVRRDAAAEHPQAVRQAHEALLASKRWGIAHPSEVRRSAAERIALSPDRLNRYFNALSYDLDARTQAGYRLYLELARGSGILGTHEDAHLYSHV